MFTSKLIHSAIILVAVFMLSACDKTKTQEVTSTITGVTTAGELYHREVNEKNPGGKDIIMTFDELDRDDKTSTARVKFVSGASVPSIMFIVRGFYDIAQERKATYFINLKEWKDKDGAWMYLVGFSNEKNINIQEYFNLKEPLSQEQQFMSVKDYDLIFKVKK
jgi:hypothetical protein